MPLSICGLQLPFVDGDCEANLQCAREAILRSEHAGHHDLYVLPELSTPGYSDNVFARREELAEDAHTGTARVFFGALAEDANAFIAYGILRRDRESGAVFICHVVVGPGQRPGTCHAVYDKMHLCDNGACSEAKQGITRGEPTPCVFDVRSVRVGLCICYDLRMPELWREMAWALNADVVLHPSAFMRDATFPAWHSFVCTRAIESQIFVLSVSHAGEQWGGSIAHPPWLGPVGEPGTRLAETVLAPTIADTRDAAAVVMEVDKDVLAAVRAHFPYRGDARLWRPVVVAGAAPQQQQQQQQSS